MVDEEISRPHTTSTTAASARISPSAPGVGCRRNPNFFRTIYPQDSAAQELVRQSTKEQGAAVVHTRYLQASAAQEVARVLTGYEMAEQNGSFVVQGEEKGHPSPSSRSEISPNNRSARQTIGTCICAYRHLCWSNYAKPNRPVWGLFVNDMVYASCTCTPCRVAVYGRWTAICQVCT